MTKAQELKQLSKSKELRDILRDLMKRSSSEELNICFTVDGDIIDRRTKEKIKYNHAKIILTKDLQKFHDCSSFSKSTISIVVDMFLKAMLKASAYAWERGILQESMEIAEVKDTYV